LRNTSLREIADCGRQSQIPAPSGRVMPGTALVVAIVAPHFTAGIVIDCNRIKKAPPWLRYMECWTVEQLQKFVRDQHWKMVELER